LSVCVQSDPVILVHDVERIIHNILHGQIFVAINNSVALLHAFEADESDCFAYGVYPYLNTFGDVINAAVGSWEDFLYTCDKDLGKNLTWLNHAYDLYEDLTHTHNYGAAGNAWGQIVKIAFSAWLFSPSLELIEISEDDATNFFEGFSSAFGLQVASQDFVDCFGSDIGDLVHDLSQIVKDLESKEIAPAIQEVLATINAFKSLDSQCVGGFEGFSATFSESFNAATSNPKDFAEKVYTNLHAQSKTSVTDVVRLFISIKGGNFNEAGNEFGQITQIALSPWLSN